MIMRMQAKSRGRMPGGSGGDGPNLAATAADGMPFGAHDGAEGHSALASYRRRDGPSLAVGGGRR